MVDLHLMAMLQPSEPTKNKFDRAYEDFLDEHVNALETTPEKKSLLKESLKLSLSHDKDIISTIRFLLLHGGEYLDEEKFQEMNVQFQQMRSDLEKMDVKGDIPDNLQIFFQLSDSFLDSIFKIGQTKFKEGDYEQSQACFALLNLFSPQNYDYHYRAGIAAQKTEQYDLALKSYAEVLLLNPEHIGAKLFSAECYFALDQPEKAKDQIEEAKNIEGAEGWTDLITSLEIMIAE